MSRSALTPLLVTLVLVAVPSGAAQDENAGTGTPVEGSDRTGTTDGNGTEAGNESGDGVAREGAGVDADPPTEEGAPTGDAVPDVGGDGDAEEASGSAALTGFYAVAAVILAAVLVGLLVSKTGRRGR